MADIYQACVNADLCYRMQNEIEDIDKNQITTRLGRGKKRNIKVDTSRLFKNAANSGRVQERFENWRKYSATLQDREGIAKFISLIISKMVKVRFYSL